MILKEDSKTYIPAPVGLHNCVCVDVQDLGLQTSTYNNVTKTQPKIRLVWELEAKQEDGKPFTVAQKFTFSMFEQAALRKALKDWRGRDFTEEERKGFDLEKVIGASCQILVTHNVTNGKTFANVKSILPAAKKLAPSGSYVRMKDREAKKDQAATESEAPEMSNTDIPF